MLEAKYCPRLPQYSTWRPLFCSIALMLSWPATAGLYMLEQAVATLHRFL